MRIMGKVDDAALHASGDVPGTLKTDHTSFGTATKPGSNTLPKLRNNAVTQTLQAMDN